ncbi:MAG: SHOCT domain-containing protein [Rhodobacteraceae bacterium]|nr:SHOCT domain-containing protein [Paracoccaceae bacterium]
MMWGGGEQWGGFGMVLGPIFMILVLVGIIVGVIYLIRTFAPHAISPMHGPTEDRALTILRERLAKGEIDSKEFEDRRRMLSQ